jgi:cysteinyl-tRNA synthetase
VLERNDAEALRYFFLGQHYRSPVNFVLDKLPDGRIVLSGVDEAERRVDYLYATREALLAAAEGATPAAEGDSPQARVVRDAAQNVFAALDDDLNTSVALSVVAELAKVGNEIVTLAASRKKDTQTSANARSLAAAAAIAITASCGPMGLMQASAQEYFARTRARRLKVRGLDGNEIAEKVALRKLARASKDFARADTIRTELIGLGVELQDVPGGGETTWRVVI